MRKDESISSIIFFWLVIIVFSVLGFSRCSRIGRIRYIEPKINDTAWSQVVATDYYYEFKNDGVTVILCPEGRGLQIISWGPALLPVIPAFTYSRPRPWLNDKFSVQLGMENPSGTSTIDLSKIEMEIPTKKILPVAKVTGFKRGEGGSITACFKHPRREDLAQLDMGLFVISSDRMSFILEFDIPIKDVDAFILHLGSLSVNGKDTKLPPLKYHNASKYQYQPFFFPLPH